MDFSVIAELTRADKPGSIMVRLVIWMLGVVVVAVSVARNQGHETKLRMDVGWFFMFLLAAGIISYLSFGFVPSF